jgi:hypothetical protein
MLSKHRDGIILPCTVAFILISMCSPDNASAEWFLNSEAKMKYDSNLTNARFSQDIVGDQAIAALVNGGRYIQLDDRTSLSVQGKINSEAYRRFHGMDHVSLGGSFTLKRKWGLGLYVPWSAISLSTEHLSYNVNVRDGWLHQAQMSGGKRISDRWDFWADLLFQRRTADNAPMLDPGISGAVFDQTSGTLKLNSVYTFDSSTFLTLGYQLRRGDVNSTTIRESPGSNIDSVMTAVTRDLVFGTDAEVYRLTGTTQTLGARISKTVATNFVLGLEFQQFITNARGNNNYYKSLLAATLSYRF